MTVPSVTGQTEQAAGATLRSAGLDAVPSLHRARASAAAGDQPVAGRRHRGRRRARAWASSSRPGPATVPLMDVDRPHRGQGRGQARKARLQDEDRRPKPARPSQRASVIATEPPADTEVQEGTPVTVFVSSGPAPVHVPDVIGQTLEAAEATLTNAELAVGTVTKQVSSTQTAGTVLAQSPDHGQLGARRREGQPDGRQGPEGSRRPERRRRGRSGGREPRSSKPGFTPKTRTARDHRTVPGRAWCSSRARRPARRRARARR